LRNERSTTVRKYLYRCGLVAVMVVALGGTIRAQDQPAARGGPRVGAIVPLKVQLVISRYQGDKKISSVPYMLSVSATEPSPFEETSRLRMGVEIPVSVVSPPTSDSKPTPGGVQAFGTNIDCAARILDNGRFKVTITIEESSPYAGDAKAELPRGTSPVSRAFRVSNVLVLKDGQSEQFSTATDRFSGEVVKMDMTISVLK
jgi:hypothetical protein